MNKDNDNDPTTTNDWHRVHARLRELGVERAAGEHELCIWLVAAERLAVHRRTGYASLSEYADRIVGLPSRRQTEERLRVGRALVALPAIDRALAQGKLCWTAVREITRVATPDTEDTWLDWAQGRRSREIERAVAGRRPGDLPGDRPDPALLTLRLTYEVKSDTYAMMRELEGRVRAELGGDIDQDRLLNEIIRRALAGPEDDGRSNYQVAVSRCDRCQETAIEAGGESHLVDEAFAAMAECDAQDIGQLDATGPHVGASKRAAQRISPRVRRHVMRRDKNRCAVPGCRNHRFLDVHHVKPQSEGGDHDPDNLIVLCGAHHRAVHSGKLQIEGSGNDGFTFAHADGTPYEVPVEPERCDMFERALFGLKSLGFKPKQARELIEAALRAGPADDVTTLIEAALRLA